MKDESGEVTNQREREREAKNRKTKQNKKSKVGHVKYLTETGRLIKAEKYKNN